MAKILVSMKDAFLQEVDDHADKEGRSRSELIREALRHYIRQAKSAQTGSVGTKSERLQLALAVIEEEVTSGSLI